MVFTTLFVRGSIRETVPSAECDRPPRPEENPADDWRAYSNGIGELHVVCPECAARKFGPDDRYEQLRGELAERLDRDARPLWRRMLGF